ncbi:NAD(P)-binding protein [Periconia macrospinosa]|uniref:NAD(P)-binding protein n=1 Tax=Periconia macrospinosa TaxID=97972 RepID=A0A2V1DEZ1_9PLEO|nr:NAD(P)-binding protein [Periconia macrospinosa]
MPPAIQGKVDFNPGKDIPSLEGKVIFITGGSAGIGSETAKTLAAHNPLHIYISGRNAKAATAVIDEIKSAYPLTSISFVPIDMLSLASVKAGINEHFKHNRLDILINCAGVMATAPGLSKDGYENQFAVNHLAHAQLTSLLLPTLLRTAALPGSDVRVLSFTSEGYGFHPSNGISFQELDSRGVMKRWLMGGWVRYGHSKLANILFASELARRHPEITAVSVHPGLVETGLVSNQPWQTRWFIGITAWLTGIKYLQPEKGCWSGVWCAAAATKEELRNGGFYIPVGVDSWNKLDKTARNPELAAKLWDWTETVLRKHE